MAEQLEDKSKVILSDSQFVYQLRNVLGFTVGGQVVLLDNSGFEYLTMVSEFKPASVVFEIISKREGKGLPSKELHLYCSIVKKDKFEWIVEKGTEIGVSRFVPIISDRSEKKDLKIDRLRATIKEAAEKSGRSTMPALDEIKSLKDAMLEEIPQIAFNPTGDVFTPEHSYRYGVLGIFIGPEDGWSDQEVRNFKQNNIPLYSLGPLILKTETAAIAASTIILLA